MGSKSSYENATVLNSLRESFAEHTTHCRPTRIERLVSAAWSLLSLVCFTVGYQSLFVIFFFMVDYRDCRKTYHAECVKQDASFLTNDNRWCCGKLLHRLFLPLL